MRILVVEDDTDLAEAVVRRLRRQGHAVDWQSNGREACEVLGYAQFDLLLLDIGLPGMDGMALLAHLRRQGNKTPVLMLTARSDIEDRVNALDEGADDYLDKPFDFRELDARCRALLRRPPRARRPAPAAGWAAPSARTRSPAGSSTSTRTWA